MREVPGRNRRLESAISILLLLVLVIIGLGVFAKQFDVDMGRFGINATDTGLPSQQIQPERQDQSVLETLMPEGFKTLSEAESYNSDNLYEKINGKAPLYIDSGFVKLFTRRFISTEDESLWMEIFVYDMAAVRNAFAVYSQQKRADVVMCGILDPQYAYKTGNALYFIRDQYYIELIGSAETEKLFNSMLEIAKDMKGRLAVDKVTEISELSLFPPDNIVAGSSKLYLKNAFGFEGFTEIFTCRFKISDEPITAFLSECSDPRDAQTTAESYYNFLIDNDAQAKTTANQILKEVGAKVLDFYGTTEIIFSAGKYVGGIHEAEDRKAAEDLAARFLERLSEGAKAIEQ